LQSECPTVNTLARSDKNDTSGRERGGGGGRGRGRGKRKRKRKEKKRRNSEKTFFSLKL
jgi:hypothetical protein